MRRSAPLAAAATAAVLLLGLDLLAGGGGFSAAGGALLWKLRLPRAATAALAGIALSLSGAQMQALFRNPLADPHIMGISGGAGLGAALATLGLGGAVSWIGGSALALCAFLGAGAASAIIMAIARRRPSAGTLLLGGVMLGFIFNAVTALLQYSLNEESLKLFYSWAAGSFSGSGTGALAVMGACTLIGAVAAFRSSGELDLLLFGEEYASLCGVDTLRTRRRILLGYSLMTGAVTAFCGPVGFVGIVAPHISRFIIRTSAHRRVLPAAVFTGASMTLAADIISQVLPFPVPVGSALALIGIPLIFVILMKRQLP